MGSKEAHFDSIRDDLEEKQQRLEAEIEGYSNRRKLYDAKEEDLEKEYENKRAELERTMQKKREALDTEYANFTKAKENFDTELKVRYYKIITLISIDNGPDFFFHFKAFLFKNQYLPKQLRDYRYQ